MLLADYRNGVRDILHDPNANFYSVTAVDRWINRARRQVAENGRCVRILPPSSAGITTILPTSGGSGYSTATITISAPDSPYPGNVQATATANLSGGAIVSFSVTNAGAGYVAPPTATITGNGTGAAAQIFLNFFLRTIPNLEVYPMATLAASADAFTPGLGDLLGIQSISISWGGFKPTLARRDFSWLQANCRSGSMQYTSNPRIWAQYGQGVTGSFYLWPVPYQYAPMEVDSYFSVADLSGSQTVDLIPAPWNEPVFYYAAYLAYMNAQRGDDARGALGDYQRLMMQARATVSTDMIPDPYGDP